MFRFIAAVSLATLLALPATASADSFTVDLGDDTIRTAGQHGVHVGDLDELGVWSVPAELVGLECDLLATSTNVSNPSVHPDNDLIVASATSVELLDIEREVGAVTYPAGRITFGESVSIILRMGPDEQFSAGLRLEFTCQPSPTTTSSTTMPETTTTTTTTIAPETTTSVAEEGPTTTTTSLSTTTSVSQAGPTSTVGQSAAASTTTVGGNGQLPATGSGSLYLMTIALTLIGIGAVMWRLRSKPAR